MRRSRISRRLFASVSRDEPAAPRRSPCAQGHVPTSQCASRRLRTKRSKRRGAIRRPQHMHSALQDELVELRLRRPIVAEVVNGRAGRRERERVKRLGSHLVEVDLRCQAGSDVWHVVLAGMIGYKHLNVFDQGQNNRTFGRGDESDCVSVLHHERSHGVNDRMLHLQQFRSRLDDNTLKAKRTVRNIVVLDGLQLQTGDMGAVQSLAGGCIDLVEIAGADVRWTKVTCGRWEASNENPLGKSLRSSALIAAARLSIVASGWSRMSMAMTSSF